MTVQQTITERGKHYGDFAERAAIAQNIKVAMMEGARWFEMSPDKREALDMIAHKISRITCGDPDHFDSWHDIAGYATLITDTLEDGQ
jgi:hypothetical protein